MQPSEMDQQTKEIVERWKSHKYRPAHVPFTDAVYSLLTDDPLIELRPSPVRGSDWMVCHAGTASPAVFTFAGVFAESDPYETGNLVWGDAPIPDGLDESRVTKFAGFKAAYSYSLETYHDKEIWDLQHTLDEYVATVPGFNPDDLPRLPWQNGETQHGRFYIRVPMFIPCAGKGPRPRVAEWLHPWVKAAHARSRLYRANPNHPRVRAVQGETVRDIGACQPSRLEYGDIVGLVFTVAYVLTPTSWGPVFMMTDVIRVQHANRVAYPLTAEEVDDAVSDDGELVVSHALAGKNGLLLPYVPSQTLHSPVDAATGALPRTPPVGQEGLSAPDVSPVNLPLPTPGPADVPVEPQPMAASSALSDTPQDVVSPIAAVTGVKSSSGLLDPAAPGGTVGVSADLPDRQAPLSVQGRLPESADEDGDSSVTESSQFSVGPPSGEKRGSGVDDSAELARNVRTRVDADGDNERTGFGKSMLPGAARGRRAGANRVRR